jgi:site-specific recombinase XerD
MREEYRNHELNLLPLPNTLSYASKKYFHDYLVNTGIRKDNPARKLTTAGIPRKKPIQLQDFTDNR